MLRLRIGQAYLWRDGGELTLIDAGGARRPGHRAGRPLARCRSGPAAPDRAHALPPRPHRRGGGTRRPVRHPCTGAPAGRTGHRWPGARARTGAAGLKTPPVRARPHGPGSPAGARGPRVGGRRRARVRRPGPGGARPGPHGRFDRCPSAVPRCAVHRGRGREGRPGDAGRLQRGPEANAGFGAPAGVAEAVHGVLRARRPAAHGGRGRHAERRGRGHALERPGVPAHPRGTHREPGRRGRAGALRRVAGCGGRPGASRTETGHGTSHEARPRAHARGGPAAGGTYADRPPALHDSGASRRSLSRRAHRLRD